MSENSDNLVENQAELSLQKVDQTALDDVQSDNEIGALETELAHEEKEGKAAEAKRQREFHKAQLKAKIEAKRKERQLPEPQHVSRMHAFLLLTQLFLPFRPQLLLSLTGSFAPETPHTGPFSSSVSNSTLVKVKPGPSLRS